jgi:hypothetical protein
MLSFLRCVHVDQLYLATLILLICTYPHFFVSSPCSICRWRFLIVVKTTRRLRWWLWGVRLCSGQMAALSWALSSRLPTLLKPRWLCFRWLGAALLIRILNIPGEIDTDQTCYRGVIRFYSSTSCNFLQTRQKTVRNTAPALPPVMYW